MDDYLRQGSSSDWTPPAGLDAELTEAGVHWDALRVPAYLGDRVLARLGEASGAVIRDPYAHRLCWLTSPAATASWRFPDIAQVQVLGAASWVTVPPGHRVRSAGPHWARPVVDGRPLTVPTLLHDALTAVIAHAFGPRSEAAR